MKQDTRRKKIIRTPLHGIPIGEALRRPDGRYILRIKRPKGNEIEDVPLERLLSMVVRTAEEST